MRSVQDEALSRLILCGERPLRQALRHYTSHIHRERPYQGIGTIIPLPATRPAHDRAGSIHCQERLGGLLTYDDWSAAGVVDRSVMMGTAPPALRCERYTANPQGTCMTTPRVVDRGDGPNIAGTSITVERVLDSLRAGRPRDWNAALVHVSSAQVQAAMDYICHHDPQVHAEYAAIVARVAKGNPTQVEEPRRANRE